ncbi:MAG TPA: sulfotransferase [Steroidobacteraceae bacterium]|jgi:predicted Zn-dependent protease|nr:sulfotransferase [Steroidobacteraceae bacterium]
MSSTPDPVGTLDVALNHAVKLLEESPALADEQAEEILKAAPRHPLALLVKAAARRKLADLPGALEILRPLAREQPGWAPAQYELGVTLGEAGLGDEAVDALYRAVQLKPDIGDAWRLLGDHLTAMGDTARADAAYANHIKSSTRDPRLLAPAIALCENRIAVAEALLREHLKNSPTDVAAIRMLAEVAARLGRLADAESLLERCLELAPGFNAARHNYAIVLHRRNKAVEALDQTERLLRVDDRNAGLRSLKAAILARLGSVDEAIELYDKVLADYPRQAKVWMSYGHSLKTAGRQPDSIGAYRRSIELSPQLGEAYWSLANLKTFRFTAEDVAAMRAQLQREDLSPEDRWHFHFALGKALEDAREYEDSFRQYAEGNRQRRSVLHYEADDTTRLVQRSKALYTAAFFESRRDFGTPARDPIFVVGLPRSGSTLVEQILSSHSAVEGTMELPDVVGIVSRLSGRKRWSDASAYPEVLESMSADELRALGERYLQQTRVQRKTAAPYFIDKLPNNWAHIGLIHLMLPNARIVDARRHPLSCCFSGFKQHFARGQAFTYSLEDVGRYYRDYVDLMAHFDRVLPGRVHRVIYERMVEDTEGEVRRLLEYCALPFEADCLRFYENERAVRTASSEQVRQPIYRQAVDQWRHYDRWLDPLRAALGPVVDSYPDAPAL